MLFQGVDVRTGEEMEKEARRLSDTLRPRLSWWDNYRAPDSVNMVMSKWGPVSYSGVLVSRAVAETTMGHMVANITSALPDHLLLMGVLGGARMRSPDALHQFPQVLRRTAVLLGADPTGIDEFRNSMQLTLDGKTGRVVLAQPHLVSGGSMPLAGAVSDAPKIVLPTANEAQSITLKWKYMP